MSEKNEKSFRITGTLSSVYVNVDDNGESQFSIYMPITDKQEEYLQDYLFENGFCDKKTTSIPIKLDDTDCYNLKCTSKFSFPLRGLPAGMTKDDIGKGTEATVYFKFRSGHYGRAQYVSAYITALDIHNFVEKEIFNPFDSPDEFDDLNDKDSTESSDSSSSSGEPSGEPSSEPPVD